MDVLTLGLSIIAPSIPYTIYHIQTCSICFKTSLNPRLQKKHICINHIILLKLEERGFPARINNYNKYYKEQPILIFV